MGKYIRKCKGASREMAVMEVTQVVGVRTRSRAMKAATLAPAVAPAAKGKNRKETEVELETYLELRSRRLFMAPRITRPAGNSGGRRYGKEASTGRISRCSSNGSPLGLNSQEEKNERLHLRSNDMEGANDLESSVSNSLCSRERERRDTTPSNEAVGEISDLESEAGEKSRRRSPAVKIPPETEIEEFFAAAEKAERDRFASKYNFDVVRKIPLEGRYEWVRLSS